MKKVGIYSLAVLVALVSIGCGGSNGDTGTPSVIQKNNEAVTLNGLKSLKSSSKIDTLSKESGVKNSFDRAGNIEHELENASILCSNKGTIEYIEDKSNKTMSINAQQCKDSSSTLDGAVSVKLEGNEENPTGGKATVTRKITLTDTENSFSLEKGATLNVALTEESTKSIKEYIEKYTNHLETTFKSKVNGVAINVSALKVTITDEINYYDYKDKSEIDVKSGEFNIGSYYFKIDESKKNTITDNVGTIHMTDGAEHKVELVMENGSVKLKVDENGDGEFSDTETLVLVFK